MIFGSKEHTRALDALARAWPVAEKKPRGHVTGIQDWAYQIRVAHDDELLPCAPLHTSNVYAWSANVKMRHEPLTFASKYARGIGSKAPQNTPRLAFRARSFAPVDARRRRNHNKKTF